ncbi:group II intron reverse transcriptase/maturase [Desulfobacterota bacterium M19]
MEDTQRSQPISTDNQRIAKGAVRDSSKVDTALWQEDLPPVLIGKSSLARIRELAKSEPEMVFTSLAHRIDLHLLKQCFRQVRKSKSCGVDKVTAKEYAEHLELNLYKLHQRLGRGQYVAQPVKRIWIDKEGGKKRPIGITALEDKIVQKAVATILNAVYDGMFHGFSHGFREGHSQHMALNEVREQCRKMNINWIVDADVSGFFDQIDRKKLIEIIKQRVNDGGILRLIGKWLNAGVIEDGEMSYPEKGTPQGAVISPTVSNIFLHYVLDDWFVKEVQPHLKRRCFLVRFADDFIVGCELESDAKKVLELLAERFESFALSLHPEKTKLIPFGKPASSVQADKRNGTFDFLGFTFYWSKALKGYWVIKKKTMGKRLNRFLKRMWNWCDENRHEPLKEQCVDLSLKLNGYYQYYGVRSNYKVLEVVYEYTEKAWRFWLSRRSHKGGISWKKFEKIRATFPLPKPRIVHNL